MYKLAESVGIKRHKLSKSMIKLCCSNHASISRYWSNHQSADNMCNSLSYLGSLSLFVLLN